MEQGHVDDAAIFTPGSVPETPRPVRPPVPNGSVEDVEPGIRNGRNVRRYAPSRPMNSQNAGNAAHAQSVSNPKQGVSGKHRPEAIRDGKARCV